MSFNTKQSAGLKWSRRDVTASVLKSLKSDLGISSLSDYEIVHLDLPDPGSFQDPEQFRDRYWAAECLSKYPFDIGIDRRAVALQQFFKFEEQCAVSNRRLANLWERPIPEGYRNVLRRAASLMEHLFRGFSVEEILQFSKWGPGASTSMRRTQASHQNKWVLAAHMTSGVRPYFEAFRRYTGWEFPEPVIVLGNKVVTVPKNAKTDRTIAIEPDWNSFFQLGVGGAIRRRLQRTFGLLHPNSQSVNQLLAKAGSMDGFLATLDLKGASDTVSLALVEALVPEHVLTHLLALRSPYGTVDGKVIPYEKISSMGNGYTFELETAIFYCICRAASGHAVAYGDDLIVPSASVGFLTGLLEFCGFTVNTKKSHYGASRFRESCGGHYFAGVTVTPPYLRKPLVGPYKISFANLIRSCSDNGSWCHSLLYNTWKTIADTIPRPFMGPVGVNDALTMDFARARPARSKRYQTFTGQTLTEKYISPAVADPVGALRQALWGSPGYLEYQKPSGRPAVVVGRWVGPWVDPSPWTAV